MSCDARSGGVVSPSLGAVASENSCSGFAKDTPILTPVGEVPVAALHPGDLVCTRDNGVQPLVATRRLAFDHAHLMAHPKDAPIMLQPGAFGADRALIVAPAHTVVLRVDGGEHLVRVADLAQMQGGAVRVMHGCRAVTYVQLVFAQRQVIFAAGRLAATAGPTAPPTAGAKPASARPYADTETLPDHLRDIHPPTI